MSNIDWFNSTGADIVWNTNTISSNNISVTKIIKEKCSVCKKKRKIMFSYKPIKIERKVCYVCFCEAMDKLFGIKANTKQEIALYE